MKTTVAMPLATNPIPPGSSRGASALTVPELPLCNNDDRKDRSVNCCGDYHPRDVKALIRRCKNTSPFKDLVGQGVRDDNENHSGENRSDTF
jgi:hypothetical protein